VRFLHTADWHIGKPLRNLRRDDEYAQALTEVLDIALRENIDCLLLAGDVFDTATPPPEAERIVFNFFRELAGAGIPAVVIGGNHDHPRRLNAFARILDLVNIHVLGEPVPGEGGVVTIGSRDGAETAVIAALPWVSERKVRSWEGLLQGDEHYADYAEEVAKMMAYLCGSFRSDTVNLMVAHLMMEGAIVGGEASGERPLHVGQAYAVNPRRLPAEAQYIALGHLHRSQEIVPRQAYYSGSLIQLDFGEAGQQKSVNVVEVTPGRPAHMEPVPLTAGRRLRDLGRPRDGLTLEQLEALAPDVDDAYLRVFVRVDRPFQSLADRVRELLPNTLDIVVEKTEEREAAEPADLMRLSPTELFLAYYRDGHTAEPPADLMQLFGQLYEEVTHEAD